MEFRFDNDDLERLYTEREFTNGLAPGVVKVFRKRMESIRAAPDERTFYGQKSLHFEKMKGARSHQHSMKLNAQWRLVMELEGSGPKKVASIKSIEDYH